MSRLGKGDCMLHGFSVADLADQDHVRGLSQGVLQRVVPGMRVDAHFPMCDKRLQRLMYELDRVFHRDDVTRRGAVR